MREYVKIYCCGDCASYNWKKHKCSLGAKDDSNPRRQFYSDCPYGIHQELEEEDNERK